MKTITYSMDKQTKKRSYCIPQEIQYPVIKHNGEEYNKGEYLCV